MKGFLIENKKLMSEWNWNKNELENLVPDNLTSGSNKITWWKCLDCGNEWKTSIHNRTKGTGCPVCSKNKIPHNRNMSILLKRGSFFDNNPELSMEWDYEKNSPLTPKDVTSGSSKKVWWICSQGHSWIARIGHRANGSGCIYCSGQKPIVGVNDLKTTNPELIIEWDYEKNIGLMPEQFKRGSNINVWWKCPLGHSWQATISHRTNGTGCPHCYSENGTSFPEQALVFYLSKYTKVENRKLVENNEIDIFLPQYNIGFEYDGKYFHSSEKSKQKEQKKDKFFENKGIIIYHIKEDNKFHFDISNKIIFCKIDGQYIYIKYVLEQIEKIINVKINNVDLINDKSKIYSQYIKSIKEDSVARNYPSIAKEWDYEKNGNISPQNFTCGSTKKVWWKCNKCGSEYITSINHRVNGTGCPYCAGKKVNSTNNLSSLFPKLVKQWDYENNTLIPEQIYYSSRQKVWWICEKCRKSYKMALCQKIKAKTSFCPSCMHTHIGNQNRLISVDKNGSLMSNNPLFLEEWNYEKNSEISPNEVTINSGIKVWWKCNKCEYEWQASIYNRTCGTGCPICAKKSGALKRVMAINVYNIGDLSFYGTFDNAQKLCEHLGLDFHKQAGNISAVCHRKNKSLMGKYILRYVKDDEYCKKPNYYST